MFRRSSFLCEFADIFSSETTLGSKNNKNVILITNKLITLARNTDNALFILN